MAGMDGSSGVEELVQTLAFLDAAMSECVAACVERQKRLRRRSATDLPSGS